MRWYETQYCARTRTCVRLYPQGPFWCVVSIGILPAGGWKKSGNTRKAVHNRHIGARTWGEFMGVRSIFPD